MQAAGNASAVPPAAQSVGHRPEHRLVDLVELVSHSSVSNAVSYIDLVALGPRGLVARATRRLVRNVGDPLTVLHSSCRRLGFSVAQRPFDRFLCVLALIRGWRIEKTNG
jgi:hypothetical protein